LATENYKVFVKPVLQMLQDSGIGASIGSIYCGCPTCADDIIFLSPTANDLQIQLHVAYDFSTTERYIIHPAKTKIQVVRPGKKPTQVDDSHIWHLGDTTVKASECCTHLGIDRYQNCIVSDKFIDDRIQLGRKTAYLLMGAGFHGVNGLSPVTTRKMLDQYVNSRMLYGLEALTITAKQREKLELFFRGLLKQLQSLPQRTANTAAYTLMGIPPIEATLDIRTLSLFGQLATNINSVPHQIACRQLATKPLTSKSWFTYVIKLCYKYKLPSPHEVILNPPTLAKWNRMVKWSVLSWWELSLCSEGKVKSTLLYMSFEKVSFSSPRSIWQAISPNIRSVARARIKARLLTGTYMLQDTRAKYDAKVAPTCSLCESDREMREHFLTACPATQMVRKRLLEPILDLVSPDAVHEVSTDQILLTQLILDHRHPSIYPSLVDEICDVRVEYLTGTLCYSLHTTRIKLINQLQPSEVAPKRKGGKH
jgi:hypothetical protein